MTLRLKALLATTALLPFLLLQLVTQPVQAESQLAAAATACERPIKGTFIHKFVVEELNFKQMTNKRKKGRYYVKASSSHGILGTKQRPPQYSGSSGKRSWIAEHGENARWIFVYYPFNDNVYPTRRSDQGNPSIMDWLSNFKVVPGSAREETVEKIYKRYTGGGSASAKKAAAKACKESLRGSTFWKVVMKGELGYKLKKLRGDHRQRTYTLYVSRDPRVQNRVEVRSYNYILSRRDMTARMIVKILKEETGISKSDALKIVDQLRETYYIPDF